MRIHSVTTFVIEVPLHKPFKTALRTVDVAQTVIVKLLTDEGVIGWGEAPPTHVITGESIASIQFAIEHCIAPQIKGMSIQHVHPLLDKVTNSLKGNTSAKAAVDMAIYDVAAQQLGSPLYRLLGGCKEVLQTDITVSVNAAIEMAEDAARFVEQGYTILKIKVGVGSIREDIERIQAIRNRIGSTPQLRLDANQGWNAKEAIQAIRQMEDAGLAIQFVEQPVPAHDIEGLKLVTDHTAIPIMADESVFSVQDARRVLEARAADLINIKLMKAGGIHEARKINTLAEAFGVPCMVGSMIETKIGITAAAHFAASEKNIQYVDFDAPLLLKEDVVSGGITYQQDMVCFSMEPGLGLSTQQTRLEQLEVQRG